MPPKTPPPNDYRENLDTRPTVASPICLQDGGEKTIVLARWWFQPDWAKAFETKFATFNARSEKVLQSKAFAPAFRRAQRCLVPMDRIYEWTGPKGDRQCWSIKVRGQPQFALAGLFNRHKDMLDQDGQSVDYSFTIFTTAPSSSFSAYHDRMPRPLPRADYDRWLDPDTSPDQAMDMLRPLDEEKDGLQWEFEAVAKPG